MPYQIYLTHHGIKGQSWGVRHGPPYPLKGGSVISKKRELPKSKIRKNSVEDKRHIDRTISKGTILSTLSYDKHRTDNTDMFYATYDRFDKHLYNALFNKKMPQEITDDNGASLGTGQFYKFRINNKVTSDVKVASEDAGTDAFQKLYSTSRDFYNYVTDPSRMQSLFVSDKYKFNGYREAAKSLEKLRDKTYTPNTDDLQKVYRMFNYTIPAEGTDSAKQRARLFTELKKKGYGAVLDTNDAIYGGFHARSPVIVFDMESIVKEQIERTTAKQKAVSTLVTSVTKKRH